jgi:cob(I)alamin adenosyltransferase
MSTSNQHSGDDGSTGILGEGRLPKYDPRIEALGSLDEVTSTLGVARSVCHSENTCQWIIQVQRDLYTMMTEIAATSVTRDRFQKIEPGRVAWLDSLIDQLNQTVTVPGEFIIPGDTFAGAALDLARTVTRRAERRVAELFHRGDVQNADLLRYLNRLSTLCFLLELAENQVGGRSNTTLARTDNG